MISYRTDPAALLRRKGVKAIALEVDVTDEQAVDASVARTLKELGGLDVLVSNAGILSLPGTDSKD